MLNKLVVVVCILAAAPYFVSALYEVKVEQTANGFIIHPKNKNTNSLHPRIIGGEEVTPHQYPFQVLLLLYKGTNTYLCGGTLISKQWVLTATHCVGMTPKYIVVALGAHDLNHLQDPDSSVVQLFNTSKYKHHRGYWTTNAQQNDIGLVRLSKDATLNQYVQLAKLATGTDTYVGKEAIILGWGQTESEDASNVLKRVKSTVITNEECVNSEVAYKDIIKSTHICVSGEGHVGSCSGDNGGPLLVDGVQVGIVSLTGCRLGMPSVFTRVTDFNDWIDQNLVDEGFDDPGTDNDDGGGDDDGGDDDDNDDGGASTHSLLFVAMASTAMCLVRFFGLI